MPMFINPRSFCLPAFFRACFPVPVFAQHFFGVLGLACLAFLSGAGPAQAQGPGLPSTALISAVKRCVAQEATVVHEASVRSARYVQQQHGEREVPLSVRMLGQRMLSLSGAESRQVINNVRWWGYTSDQVDAQAAGTDVVLLSSAVWEAGLSASEQAAVVAHELAHLTHGHVAYWLCLQKQPDGQPWLEPLRQDMEDQADATARRWLEQAGFDPQALQHLRQRENHFPR